MGPKALQRRIATAASDHHLDLQGCGLTEVPSEVRGLRDLRVLDISHNSIESLPLWFGELEKLVSFDAPSNKLREFPVVLRNLKNLRRLNLFSNDISVIPDWIGELSNLEDFAFGNNPISDVPESIKGLTSLTIVDAGDSAGGCPLGGLPPALRHCVTLQDLMAEQCEITLIPDWIEDLKDLSSLSLANNLITDVPSALLKLKKLGSVDLAQNPLIPEVQAALEEGWNSLKRYLKARGEGRISLHEAKLILVGEGEVGKSCLLRALRNEPWIEGNPTTHGIEIKSVSVKPKGYPVQITLNGWDFGGQRVYRPTHQLFFSSPAIYLVVWKPREGPQQGLVSEWLTLIKHREPDAKVLIVATHGGPKERQPDIDRQELWDRFGKSMIVDFFSVDSRPQGRTGRQRGIRELLAAVGELARSLPEMGREVPSRWDATRKSLQSSKDPYLPLKEVLRIAASHGMSSDEAMEFVRISHRLGHLIHYQHDPLLRDIVVLKPDWLATAVSYVLDDAAIRASQGLVTFERLARLWNDPRRGRNRYPPELHPIFLRLMERFDLSYRIADPTGQNGNSTSLIAQLVPDLRPDLVRGWDLVPQEGDQQQAQICRIVDNRTGQSAPAEGLFYQLIVRLHKYSLGRRDHAYSSHWQRGMVLEDDYGARALLENLGNDVKITVRSPYPERFLAALTYEVKWLVDSFWAGLRCDVMVPCLNPEGCAGLFEVRNLLENKRRGHPQQPCSVCNEWQRIDLLLNNAPADKPGPLAELLDNSKEVMRQLSSVRDQITSQRTEMGARFDRLDASDREIVSKVDAGFTGLMRAFVDEAREGPRLFSFEPMEPNFLGRPKWMSSRFRVTLWCEHSRVPLPVINGADDRSGVYELDVPREWLIKAAPYLKVLSGALSLIIPVAAAASKVVVPEDTYKAIEKQIGLAEKCATSLLRGAGEVGEWLTTGDVFEVPQANLMRAKGADLRQLHVWLSEKDPGFGGLVRVQNKRQEFVWVHPKFEGEF
jgi:hypothetical protein